MNAIFQDGTSECPLWKNASYLQFGQWKLFFHLPDCIENVSYTGELTKQCMDLVGFYCLLA